MTTDANDNWKSKVEDKIIEEKDVVKTYTFLYNGDIKVETKDKKTSYTLNFWGATNCYNYLFGIYYVKFNLQDIFGDIAPNEETYFYYGYKFDENIGYRSYLPELIEYWQHHLYYCDTFTNWYKNNFDKKGKSRGNINWSTMPLQTPKNIAFWNPQENIILFERQK